MSCIQKSFKIKHFRAGYYINVVYVTKLHGDYLVNKANLVYNLFLVYLFLVYLEETLDLS
jgi:hypothetical protein